MYNQYFGFADAPFSIAPDPRYLFLSEQHREALAHLLYGIGDKGGFVVLTGEVGTGKTTVCRCLLQQLPEHADVAFIVNPKLDSRELLQTICEELGVGLPEGELSIKQLIDALNDFLLSTHARGRNAILIIDEAQNLEVDVLEQLRLLTNLETSERKLLQLILLGQPELNTLLERADLRQLAQRITARYHLRPLSREETALYIEHRLAIAGCRGHIFAPAAVQRIFRYSQGIPRLINLLCDRALLGVYAGNGTVVDVTMVKRAAAEVLPAQFAWRQWLSPRNVLQAVAIAAGVLVVSVIVVLYLHRPATVPGAVVMRETSAQVNWLNTLAAGSNTESAALNTIYRTWERELPTTGADLICAGADGTDWGCIRLEKQTLADLKQLNRPVVLFLTNSSAANNAVTNENAPLSVALLQLQGDNALVSFGGREWTLPWKELAAYWSGTLALPLPAPIGSLPLKPGDHDALAGWLDDQLYRHYHQNRSRWLIDTHDDSARLGDVAPRAAWLSSFYLGLHAAPRRETFDDALVDELKRFQKDANLRGDGVVDLATVLALVAGSDMAGSQLIPRVDNNAAKNAVKKKLTPAAEKALGDSTVGG